MHSKEQKVPGTDFLNAMTEAPKKAQQQLKAAFKDITDEIEISMTVAMVCFLEREDSQKIHHGNGGSIDSTTKFQSHWS